jgi:hypothetical protein
MVPLFHPPPWMRVKGIVSHCRGSFREDLF